MDNLQLAREVKALLPSCNVIYRVWPDDGLPEEAPEAWVARRRNEIGDADVWCYTTNEPPFVPQLFDWHVRAMREALRVGLKLCVFNLGVGSPEPDDWGAAHEVLRLLAARPDMFVLGLHEYACATAVSGARGFEAIAGAFKLWPANLRERAPLWHCGRFQFLVDYCARQEMRPPRIVITEAGFDDLQDVRAWTDTLLRTPPYTDIRGWKTLRSQWQAWWPAWDAEQAYYEQVKYLARALYANSPVEGVLLFAWNANPSQEQFDLSEALTFQRLLEGDANVPVDINPDINPSVDDARWQPYIAQAAPAGTRIRQNPSTASTALVTIVGAIDVHHIPFDALTPAEQARAQQGDKRWHVLKIDTSQVVGWAREDVIKLTPKTAPAPPSEPKPEPEPPTYITPAMLQAVVDALRAELQTWARKEFATMPQVASAIDTRILALSNRIAAAWLAVPKPEPSAELKEN